MRCRAVAGRLAPVSFLFPFLISFSFSRASLDYFTPYAGIVAMA